jgi:hypothetical protein
VAFLGEVSVSEEVPIVATDGIRAMRWAENQATFRSINERIETFLGGEGGETSLPHHEFLCECAEEGCFELLSMSLDEYRRVRVTPVTFAVYPDEAHVFPDIESVVQRSAGFWVVEKQEQAARLVTAAADARGE